MGNIAIYKYIKEIKEELKEEIKSDFSVIEDSHIITVQDRKKIKG